jgi:hypothetical protein
MQPDKFKRRHRVPATDARKRRQIALEAARRMFSEIGPTEPGGVVRDATEAEYYTAKRKAAAVLGHRVRPGDLPSDAEVRDQIVELSRISSASPEHLEPISEPDTSPADAGLGEQLDRFAIYKMRLVPLETVKQNPRWHPEGDALYHSLQVFERARDVRPYDEEFLIAALLHDVGKAIDAANHVAAGLDALLGTITKRTAWLIAHHMDLLVRPDRSLSPKLKRSLEESPYYEDLVLLRDVDEAGRVPGVHAGTIDDALAYLKGLENEDYLQDERE